MLYVSSRLIRSLIFSLAGCANFIFVSPGSVFGRDIKSPAFVAPKVDHILLELSDLTASIAFDQDFLGLRLKSRSHDFVTLESGNVVLWSGRWDWERSRTIGERQGLGMYPHFEVNDAAATVDRARQAGYRIVQGQENMIGALKRSLPTPTVTPGRLCLRQSKHPPFVVRKPG